MLIELLATVLAIAFATAVISGCVALVERIRR